MVVALAEHDVDDLDCRQRSVGREDVGDRVDAHRAVTDAAGVLAGLAERARATAETGEVEALPHVQAGQRGRREGAGQVFDAAVVVDVQRVDLLPLGRLRCDLERRRVVLARQQHGGVDRAVGGRGAALDGQRPADAGEQVRLLAERLPVLAAGREEEERITDERDGRLLVPGTARRDRAGLRRVVLIRSGEGRNGRPLGHGQRDVRRGTGQQRRVIRDQQHVGLARRRAGDRVDLEERAGERVDLEQLALEEAGVEPALAVVADQRAAQPVDLAGVRACGRRSVQRQLRVGNVGDDEVGRSAQALEADAHVHGKARVEEARAARVRDEGAADRVAAVEQRRDVVLLVADRPRVDAAVVELADRHAAAAGHRGRAAQPPSVPAG